MGEVTTAQVVETAVACWVAVATAPVATAPVTAVGTRETAVGRMAAAGREVEGPAALVVVVARAGAVSGVEEMETESLVEMTVVVQKVAADQAEDPTAAAVAVAVGREAELRVAPLVVAVRGAADEVGAGTEAEVRVAHGAADSTAVVE